MKMGKVDKHHVMLIAINGQQNIKVKMWRIIKDDKHYMRVLVLISGLT